MSAKTNYNVDAVQFVRIWTECKTATEVAERLGVPRPIVLARASKYRKAGVKLKKLEREVRSSFDVEKLNQIVEQAAQRMAEDSSADPSGPESPAAAPQVGQTGPEHGPASV
jgi:hypothetical protein